ncbi:MAG: site-2 protease family protein [Candidatus Bathyarchaeia archaeon]
MSEYTFALFFLVFWLVIYILGRIFPVKRYGFDVKPFFIKYESERFKRLLYKYSSRWRFLWRMFSYISVLLGFGLMLFAIVFLSENLLEVFLLSRQGAVIAPVIPGLTLSLYWLPYFLVAVIVAIFIHEAMHGILAILEGISVKSAGALVLGIFLGGCGVINEEELSRLPYTSRMKIFSAGSSSNILGGLLVFLLMLALFSQSPSGVIVLEVLEGGPLDTAGIERWDVIYALNGTLIRTYQDLTAFMSNVKPGDRLIASTSRGNITITTIPSPDDARRAIIGIISLPLLYYPSRLGLGFFWDIQVYLTLNWLFIVLVNVAVFNMLPIPLFDGDKLLQCLLEKAARKSNVLKKLFNILSIFLIAANMALNIRL